MSLMNTDGLDVRGARILIVDDTLSNLSVLCQALESVGYRVMVANSGAVALEIASASLPDLILLDVMMPEMDGFETCRRLKAAGGTRTIPVIFLTGRDEVEDVIEGFRAGGVDYIIKPFQQEEVLIRIQTHLERALLMRQLVEKNRQLEEETARRRRLDSRLSEISRRETERWGIAGFVGQSQTLKRILEDVNRLRSADTASVLITGESGTGKELIARAIHLGSSRAEGPFVPVNCAAVPADLAESLFFGHAKGAFSGADREQAGFFELSDGGTLFLDEIGAMPAGVQPKLLRALEDHLIRPLGARADRRVDVRILAATNASGMLRTDLYFRLARFTVEVPPLRQRREDIPALARHFLRMFSVEMGIEAPDLSPEALRELDAYDFPGNVRELKNIIERALLESGGADIQAHHLRWSSFPQETAPQGTTSPQPPVEELPLNFAQAEALLVRRALEAAGGNVSKAARLLGIDRNKVYRKLAQERQPPERRIPGDEGLPQTRE